MKSKSDIAINLLAQIAIILLIGVVVMAIVYLKIQYNNQHSGNNIAVIKLDNGESITVEIDYWTETLADDLVKIKGKTVRYIMYHQSML